ncbi:MAG: hypothetical protein AAF844_00780 [Pseudomonadota bacterium]
MRNSPSGRSIGSVSIVAALTRSSTATAQSVQAIDVPAQSLTAAIIELGRETGWEIGGAIDDFGGISSNPVIGEMTLRDALELMIAGFGPRGAAGLRHRAGRGPTGHAGGGSRRVGAG